MDCIKKVKEFPLSSGTYRENKQQTNIEQPDFHKLRKTNNRNVRSMCAMGIICNIKRD